MITSASIENLKNRIDILEIISHYLELKRVGSNYATTCPFHNEKSPSFMISPSKGIFHCYGCGIGGDSIKFVMEYEKLGFVEAIEKIADMLDFRLEYDSKERVERTDTLEKIAAFYHTSLLDSAPMLAYLHKRGIDDRLIAQWNLGFCPSHARHQAFINAQNLPTDELLKNGIIGKNEQYNQPFYPRFGERIMFPIYSANGKVVGFGGRSIKEGALAKYLNSPQNPLFNKSRLLYGYHLAKQAIFASRQIIITEGYIDTIMLHKAGINNAVATLGTALTKEHIPLLNKGEPEIILSYDGDKAGINAAFRASSMLAPLSKKGGVVIFPDGADPADMILAGREQEVKKLFASPTPFIEFGLTMIASKHNLANPLSKEDALKEIKAFLHTLSPLMQEEYAQFSADLLQVPLQFLHPKAKAPKPKPIQAPESSGDKLERLILRYMLEDEALLNQALLYIDRSIFTEYQAAFDALCANDPSHPQLLGIALDPLPLCEGGFEAELRIFILRFLESKLKQTKDLAQISQLRAKILSLKTTKSTERKLQPI